MLLTFIRYEKNYPKSRIYKRAEIFKTGNRTKPLILKANSPFTGNYTIVVDFLSEVFYGLPCSGLPYGNFERTYDTDSFHFFMKILIIQYEAAPATAAALTTGQIEEIPYTSITHPDIHGLSANPMP